jgi:hypothetical protein
MIARTHLRKPAHAASSQRAAGVARWAVRQEAACRHCHRQLKHLGRIAIDDGRTVPAATAIECEEAHERAQAAASGQLALQLIVAAIVARVLLVCNISRSRGRDGGRLALLLLRTTLLGGRALQRGELVLDVRPLEERTGVRDGQLCQKLHQHGVRSGQAERVGLCSRVERGKPRPSRRLPAATASDGRADDTSSRRGVRADGLDRRHHSRRHPAWRHPP